MKAEKDGCNPTERKAKARTRVLSGINALLRTNAIRVFRKGIIALSKQGLGIGPFQNHRLFLHMLDPIPIPCLYHEALLVKDHPRKLLSA